MLGVLGEQLAFRFYRAASVICRTEPAKFSTPGTDPGRLGRDVK